MYGFYYLYIFCVYELHKPVHIIRLQLNKYYKFKYLLPSANCGLIIASVNKKLEIQMCIKYVLHRKITTND